MIFLDGDERLLPWAPDALPLLQLMHMCCTSGKCMLGCGCAVQLMTYLASVGPTTLAVVNGPAAVGQTVGAAATGGAVSHFSVHDGDDGGAPGSPPLTPRGGVGGGGAPADGVWLENRTGDIFRHDLNERAWVPIGNVGLHCSFGSLSGAAHARSEINRSDGVGTAEIAVLARHHPLRRRQPPAEARRLATQPVALPLFRRRRRDHRADGDARARARDVVARRADRRVPPPRRPAVSAGFQARPPPCNSSETLWRTRRPS